MAQDLYPADGHPGSAAPMDNAGTWGYAPAQPGWLARVQVTGPAPVPGTADSLAGLLDLPVDWLAEEPHFATGPYRDAAESTYGTDALICPGRGPPGHPSRVAPTGRAHGIASLWRQSL